MIYSLTDKKKIIYVLFKKINENLVYKKLRSIFVSIKFDINLL